MQPRKGTFAVRVVGGDDPVVIVSLEGLDRPFKKLRDCDLD